MSVDACKWARMADVQKSTSKLVLLNLAQLVRYDDQDWTAFASIEFLARVSHLNRKTVIEALGRLRQLGAIQDTGSRAGENRSTIVYRLCPDAVPVIGLSPSGIDADLVEDPPATTMTPTGDASGGLSPAIQAPYCEQPPITSAPVDSEDRCLGRHTPVAAPSAGRPTLGLRPSSPPRTAATRLPRGFTLPASWQMWTQRERPHWTVERIQALATTFCAYMRSRPGAQGASADWFESWRLWVFRERESGRPSTAWQESWSGIVRKGNSLTIYQAPNEPDAHFKARVYEAAGLPPPY